MIRNTSEAICETVGSLMNQHCGKNRQLTPFNFSKELVLRYNLGPLHILEKSLISEVLDRQKGTEFIRKETSVNLKI